MTFTLDIKTAEDRAAEALEAAKDAARAECRRRILDAVDETAQINLAAAVAVGLLSDEELSIYRAGLGWVARMRAAWGPIAEAGKDPADDANWPAPPPGAAELAARF